MVWKLPIAILLEIASCNFGMELIGYRAMKTDHALNDEIKDTRKRVFWRLYVLPWLLLVMGLLGVCLYVVSEYKDLRRLKVDSLVGYDEGFRHGMEMVQKEAVENGHGSWEVDVQSLKVVFAWKVGNVDSVDSVVDNVAKEDQDVSKMEVKGLFEGGGSKPRQHPFTYDDLLFAQGLGMDLERDLKISVRLAIRRVFDNTDSSMDRVKLGVLLESETDKVIHKQFDGFETYKSLK